MRCRLQTLAALAALCTAGVARGDTTISASNRDAYGANIGWIDARGDVTNGAGIGQFFCTGYVWSANCGWISLGNGPTNGWRYSNAASSDWGVNHDGAGALRGMAYGANIGWIAFESNGNPRVDLRTGALSGSAWGANVGWIGLSNTFAFARTDTLDPGRDSDGDGIPDAWELANAGSLTNLGAGDRDNDGASDRAEYLADTDPLTATSRLDIVSLRRDTTTNLVAWSVEPTRLYRLEQAASATNNAAWSDTGIGLLSPGPGPTLTGLVVDAASSALFYRARAVVPLSP
jgi:hypothetical protein